MDENKENRFMRNQVVNCALDYILENITSNPTVDDVAEKCGYSKYYLERLFKAEVGESIYSCMKRIKVEQSAFRLKMERERSITDVGGEYGYSPSNYATVFRNHFGVSPVKFRKEIYENSLDLLSFEQVKSQIRIEHREEYFVLYERHKSDYDTLKKDWCDFIQRNAQYYTPDTRLIDITYDDPSIVDPGRCLYDICMTVDKNDPRLQRQKTAAVGITSRVHSEIVPSTMTIPGGKFAVYRYKGRPESIYQAYQSIFRSWLVETDNQIDNRYGYDYYHEVGDDMYLDMDICIPIK